MTQPKDPQEPRQFWIDDILNVDRPSQKIAYIYEQDTEKCHRAIHVIDYSAYQSIQSKLEKAEAENKKLRDALEFYSDKESWNKTSLNTDYLMDRIEYSDLETDGIDMTVRFGGKRARQALKGEEES